jgi:Predicted integral membrane protein
MNELTTIVKNSYQFRQADTQGKLVRIPTGDGMCLVFFDDPQAPLECAVEIARALRDHPSIGVRMGIHSGPVNEVVDVNDRSNLAGAGMDMTQRVLSCGDAGHILLSKRVADDLAPFPRWNPDLHELGECEVKHGRRIALVNFYNDEIGNSAAPSGLAASAATPIPSRAARRRTVAAGAVLLGLIAVGAMLFFTRFRTFSPATVAAASGTIAVLPLENPGNDPNTEYLAEGISESLINSLTEIPKLRVTARSTAFQYKGKIIDPRTVGRDLQVSAVLTGKVRQVNDTLNVQVDLIDTGTGAQLWGAAYDRKMSEILAVKQAIVREITQKLELRLSGEEEHRLVRRDTTSPEAYQLYLKGRYFWNKRTREGLEKGVGYFQQAIEADPSYALAYVGLADSYNFLGAFGIAIRRPGEAMPKARSAALRALEIDESLAEAHASLAFVKLYYEWDWAGAEKDFERAIALNPKYAPAHQWYSHLLMSVGRTDESIARATQAAGIDPLSLPAAMNVGWQYYWARRYDVALKQLQKVLEIEPNFEQGRWGLGLAYEGIGLPQQAVAEFQKAIDLSTANPVYVAGLGHAHAVGGNKEAALQIRAHLEELSRSQYVSPFWMAILEAGLGDVERAFSWLEKAYEERSGGLVWLRVDPKLDPLRSDPRFTLLLSRVRLSP